MPTVNVNIQQAILRWTFDLALKSNIEPKIVDNIKRWLDGSKRPTFQQIEKLSKKMHIPLGYFFLQEPPKEQIKLLEYRTLQSVDLDEPSRNLIDTIHDMENVQDWMIAYRKEGNYDTVSCVGSMKGNTEVNAIAEAIRGDLELDIDWYTKSSDSVDAFNYVRRLLEEYGIIVMINGVVGNNTHRVLDLNEFRAFAMVDDWAPLIFINGADSAGGRLFSLFHEIVHLWIGENDLFNDRIDTQLGINQIEVICNAVAGELMVPMPLFLEKWNNIKLDSVHNKIKILAKVFRCSNSVIARRALDKRIINSYEYNQVIQSDINAYMQIKQKKKSGGNYYIVAHSKLDGVFVRALCESINSGRTSFSEAYRLTNTNSKTFPKIAKQFGGAVCC